MQYLNRLLLNGKLPSTVGRIKVGSDAIALLWDENFGVPSAGVFELDLKPNNQSIGSIKEGTKLVAYQYADARAFSVWFFQGADGQWWMLDAANAEVIYSAPTKAPNATRYIMGVQDTEHVSQDELGMMVVKSFPVKLPLYVDQWAIELGIEVQDEYNTPIAKAIIQNEYELAAYCDATYEVWTHHDFEGEANGLITLI